MPLDYYLALLQLHIAVIGLVIGGILAIVQLLNNARPHRELYLIVSKRLLYPYGGVLISVLIILTFAVWVSAFPGQARTSLGPWSIALLQDNRVALAIIILSLSSLVWFGLLALRTRTLLDSQAYLQAYVRSTTAKQVHEYVKAVHGGDDTVPVPYDPFQPIREYIKDTAFQYYDYGTARGLQMFGELYDKSFQAITTPTGYVQMAQYAGESSEELFMIFSKSSSEKRKLDTIKFLNDKGIMLLDAGSSDGLLIVVRSLENIAKQSTDDDEIIAVIGYIRQLCDQLLTIHSKDKWHEIAGPFDEICLSVTRITEDYYLHKNNSLKTVPIIGYSTGTHQTVTTSLVDFFYAYRNLGDRYVDTTPVYYFQAIESVIEVLFLRLGDIIVSGQQNIGFNMKYHDLACSLYTIYYDFGVDAVQHKKPELLALSLTNLRRIIKPAKNFKLTSEQSLLCNMIVELAANSVEVMGDLIIKSHDRTISAYAAETLAKHAESGQIAAAVLKVRHGIEGKKPSPDTVRLFNILTAINTA